MNYYGSITSCSIASREADWKVYQELCDPTLTCFEPEASGQLVEGMEFHRFYFQLSGASSPHNTTMASPHVRIMGDVAIVSYVRLNQARAGGRQLGYAPGCRDAFRQKQNVASGKHVHFHR